MDRWYGYVQDADEIRLSVVGPFVTPRDSLQDAVASLERWRRPIVSAR